MNHLFKVEKTRITIKPGQTFLGTRHSTPESYDVSDNWAKHLVETGVADYYVKKD